MIGRERANLSEKMTNFFNHIYGDFLENLEHKIAGACSVRFHDGIVMSRALPSPWKIGHSTLSSTAVARRTRDERCMR